MRFYIDPETDEPHIYEHGVTEEEVQQVLQRPGEDRAGDEGSRVAIGQTAAGRHLKVIYERDPDDLFVITAFDLRGKPLKAYRRRQRRKRR
jgi:predicted ArsR family transcriptional regulator